MDPYYAAVFGAGISGTAIANELSKRDKSVLLIDPYVSENAPGPPAGMVNPATGKRAKLGWRSLECMTALRDLIEELSRSSGRNDLISDSGVIRPAINETLAENFRDALENFDWPEGWIRWMDQEEVAAFNPEIASNHGALFLDSGFTVFVDRYLNTYRQYLRKKGVECRYDKAEYTVDEQGSGFKIHFSPDEILKAEHVILAAGHHTPFFKEWKYLPLHRVKGQVVWFEADSDLNWDHGTSAMGYSLRFGKRDLIVGSTYEHHFDNLETTDEATDQIRQKLNKMFPQLSNRLTIKGQMAGARVTSPNRLPVIGRHPEIKNLCIYSALGSTGLLFSQYVGSLLAGHLVFDTPIPEELEPSRF
ncbi:MAG: FAD-binding oxidoreductase [Balneolaceae bacterium]